MRSAITVTLVPEVKSGPFVFSDGLEDACARAAEIGFDAIEIFPPSAMALEPAKVKTLLARHGLGVAALGTGAGWVLRKLSLTSSDAAVRREAREFIRSVIDVAGSLGAPAIIGSMQGRWETSVSRDHALGFLGEALHDLGAHAARYGVALLYEPLNRYETNILNRLGEAAAWLGRAKIQNVRLLADLFHMNIDEASTPAALREAGPLIGHVHFADSNRRAVGMGQTSIAPIIAALREIGYAGFLSAEIFPLPDSMSAARQTMAAFRQHVSIN